MAAHTKRLLLARPRGYCAGVERGVQSVEKALELFGAPVYVRKQIVHNTYVVAMLERKGAVFVEDNHDVPAGGVSLWFCQAAVADGVGWPLTGCW
jgi:4-hydroxy-3-methylbut-2-en-1-yl diphosphate reductase